MGKIERYNMEQEEKEGLLESQKILCNAIGCKKSISEEEADQYSGYCSACYDANFYVIKVRRPIGGMNNRNSILVYDKSRELHHTFDNESGIELEQEIIKNKGEDCFKCYCYALLMPADVLAIDFVTEVSEEYIDF